MTQVHVSGLLAPALSYAVAVAMGYKEKGELRINKFCSKPGFLPMFTSKYDYMWPQVRLSRFDPVSGLKDGSQNWVIDLIMKECITSVHREGGLWIANIGDIQAKGSTYRFAVLRAFVASRLGETVEIPTELL